MLGSFIRGKNADLFLRAIKKLKADHPDFQFKFVIIGMTRKPYWKTIASIFVYWNFFPFRVQSLLDSSDIKTSVILLPVTDSIQAFYDSLLIYVRPSGHPWGRDIIEAMAFGVPVVASGTSEFFIKHRISGLLAKPEDPQDLADKIFLLASDNQLCKEFISNAYQIVKDKCDMAQHAKAIQGIYETC
jgi:glycosyltransferase involved in cell wall biosynthesis